MQIDWGDGSRKLRRRSAVHSYKKGRYTLKVTAADKAGNLTVKSKACGSRDARPSCAPRDGCCRWSGRC